MIINKFLPGIFEKFPRDLMIYLSIWITDNHIYTMKIHN